MKRKLFFAMVALLSIVGVRHANAYTVDELTSAGWEEVTSLPTSSSELGKYYYVFWETQADLMLGEENGSGKGGNSQENQLTGVYRTPADPASDKTKVWILEYNATNFYGIRNLSNPQLLLQSRENATYRVQAAWERIQSIWTQWGFTYADGKWSIQNKLPSDKGGGDNNWIGPWDKDAFQDNMVVAGNAGGNGNKKGLFKIYRKSRLAYDGTSYNYASATAAAPLNVTALITNANFDHSTAGWNVTGEKPNAFNTDYKAFEAYHRIGGINQDITGIPNGKYAVSVQVACRDDNGTKVPDNLPHLVATSAYHTVSVVSNESPKDNFANTAKAMNDDASYAKISVNVNVTDGNLNVALNENNNNTWPVYDNFTLSYYGPTVAGEAVALPGGGAMAAGQWYYIDIPAAAEYNATATTLDNIIYTTDGEILIENEGDIADQFVAKDNALSKARYYVKSSTVNNLEIAVAADTYTLNEGTRTFNISDGQYINSLTTFVVTYPDAETTSSDELVLIGTPKAALLKGSTPIAEGSLTGSNIGKTLTATFEGVELDPASTYTIQIAAGVFGYAGQAVNEAISLNFNTGVIAEGLYYFQKKGTQKYLGRGGNYGTEAVVADLGISFELSLQADGSYTFKNHDHSLAAASAKYLNYNDGDGDNYTDQTAYGYKLEATDGGYYLRPDASYYMTSTNYIGELDVAYDYLNRTLTVGDAIVWVPISKETYNSNIAAVRDAEAAAIASSAGISATTLAALKTAIAANYGSTDVTSSIKNAGCRANLDNWTQVKYAPNGQKDFDANGTCGEVWAGLGGIKQSITGLNEGIYKVSIRATWRPGNKASGTNAGNEINTNAWVYANTATSENLTQLKSWYSGGATIDSRAAMVESGDAYLNEVYVYVSEGETLTIGLASPTQCNGAWLPFFDWTLTYYEAKATPAEKTALDDAIDAAEGKTLGFEDGEYAPYNNVAALVALATAKAINPETASGKDVVAATTALASATWTANVAEVNAFYDGDFSECAEDTSTPLDDTPNGWTATNNFRLMLKNVETYPGLADASAQSAPMSWSSGITYGEQAGYEMPLKANSIYRLSFKAAGWNNETRSGMTVRVLNSTDGMAAMNLGTPDRDIKGNATNIAGMTTFEVLFATGAAGNYVFHVQSGNNFVITDLSLVKAASQTLSLPSAINYAAGTYPTVALDRTFSADNWNTLCVPFAFDKSDFAEVKELSAITVNGENVSMTLADASTIEAGKPYLVKAINNGDVLSATNVTLPGAGVQASSATADDYTVNYVGTYTGTTVNAETADGNAFVVKNNGIYHVNSNVSVGAYRAYFTVETASLVKALSFDFDGTTTAINAVEAAENEKAEIYNLAGQRLNKAQKGVNIINGKKVLVK